MEQRPDVAQALGVELGRQLGVELRTAETAMRAPVRP
jgi:hypothetical protein